MAGYTRDAAIDAFLKNICDYGNKVVLCSGLPATYTEATDTFKLTVPETLVVGDGNGDYTIANGTVSGRKLTLTATPGVVGFKTGTATHWALVDSAAQELVSSNTLNANIPTTDSMEVDIPETILYEHPDPA